MTTIGSQGRILVVGAGAAGRAVVRELAKARQPGFVIAGFVDDDPRKLGKPIGKSHVIGTIADLPKIVAARAIDQVLISVPSSGADLVARIADLLPAGFPIKILPSATSVLLKGVELSYIRDLGPPDFVSQALSKPDQKLIARRAAGKTFLVTGGAGSIGSEIVRQLRSMGAKRVVVLDSREEGIFNLLEEFNPSGGRRDNPNIVARIGSIRDVERLNEIFAEFPFDAVIHAAALKHVPLMEENPGEARKTNVIGTRNVLEACARHKIQDFVLISTDKAVRPISVLGATKREAELLVKAYARRFRKRRFIAVRFGNVLNSSGSVIPTFVQQIQNRRAVTVTDSEATRYFISIPQAVSLTLTAWTIGRSGQILLLDMGSPVRILDLALHLIRLHGLEPYKDVPVEVIGLRPGEKTHEELSYEGALKRSIADRIYIAEEI